MSPVCRRLLRILNAVIRFCWGALSISLLVKVLKLTIALILRLKSTRLLIDLHIIL